MALTNDKNKSLPEFFRPLLWSYDFAKIDLEKHKKTIIVNTINYGTLKHWHWLASHYGKLEIKKMLEKVWASELRKKAAILAGIIFSIKEFNYAPRGVKR